MPATLTPSHAPAIRGELRSFVDRARTPRLRSMREFAEQEIVIPDGPFAGLRYRADRQPYTGLFFDAVDSGRYNTVCATGPTQSGKTLTCDAIPIMHHLFERNETVVMGVPDMNMAADKWREDLLPAIRASRYAEYLPTAGRGSKGGSVTAIQFRNGVTLKFMAAGGGDKGRAGFTTRVVAITETDGFDSAGESSRETDKVSQIIARTRAYGDRKRVYLECTVSIEEGFIWQGYMRGTHSRIAIPCVHCGAYVSPERKHMMGWQDADTEVEAARNAHFICPSCGAPWSRNDRLRSNRAAKLIHHGQSVGADGTVSGDAPETKTLGFRWSAVNNFFGDLGEISVREWKAARLDDDDPKKENAERELCQFDWAIPYQPPEMAVTPLDAQAVARRVSNLPRGMLPDDTEHLTVGCDLGKWIGHYVVMAFRADGGIHIPEYGLFKIYTDQFGVEQATLIALREFRDVCMAGYVESGGAACVPEQVWIDSGWAASQKSVYAFCRESDGARFRPTKGLGAGQDRRLYTQPTRKTRVVRVIGDHYHIARMHEDRVSLAQIDSNYWKSWLHQRLSVPFDAPGAATIFRATAAEHRSFAKQLTAEKQVVKMVEGKGEVVTWEQTYRNNHWLDAAYLACAAGHLAGFRLFADPDDGPNSAGSLKDWFAGQRRSGHR